MVQIALDNDQNIPFIAPDVFDKASILINSLYMVQADVENQELFLKL